MENYLALRAVIDEAEILIFPSSLLPEQYQTFQTKHYLWGVFKPREEKAAPKMALER
uniref:AIPP2-like SPOC-like domain-containing protein n=1 Tax=Arundo donax TaxID=35708 RepID=A0A0A8YE30_ARUDO